jgi:hypothetical protein
MCWVQNTPLILRNRSSSSGLFPARVDNPNLWRLVEGSDVFTKRRNYE